jgi:hypothetical protein
MTPSPAAARSSRAASIRDESTSGPTLHVALNNQIVRNLLMSLSVNTTAGDADTLLTGRDDNGDGIFNDRPAGVGRNTLRASGQTNVNVFVAYQFAFGRTAHQASACSAAVAPRLFGPSIREPRGIVCRCSCSVRM